MAIPDESWRRCYVGFFDILGISEALQLRPGDAAATISKLHDRVELALDTTVTDGAGRTIPRRTCALTFSDSLLLFTTRDDDDDIQSLLATVVVFFCHSFGYSIPLRGAVAKGMMCIDHASGVYTGPALLHAYSLSESADWLGICCDDTVASHSNAVGMKTYNGVPLIVPAQIPQKQGTREGFALNWPALLSHEIEDRPVTPERLHRYFRLASSPFKKLSSTAASKYQHAAAFFNTMTAAF